MKSVKQFGLKGMLVGIAFFLSLCILIEASVYLFLPKDRLDKVLNVLERDKDLIWKQRNNLATTFFGKKIITNEIGLRNRSISGKKIRPRIVVLGASPSFGWGVSQEQTYPKVLEELLEEKAEVINASTIGYSSYQGLKFFKKNIDFLNPDIVIVSYVINDVDRYRFFENIGGADSLRPPALSLQVSLSNILLKLEITRLLRKFIIKIQSIFFGYNASTFLFETARVPIKQYENNILEFIDLSKKYNFKLILMKMPVNLPIGPMTLKVKNSELVKLANSSCKLRLKKIDLLLKSDSLNPLLYHLKAKCLSGEDLNVTINKLKQVQSHLAARDALSYNKRLEVIAKKTDTPLIDIVLEFKNHSDDYLFVDKKLDTIHPNGKGHKIIAEALFKPLSTFLGIFKK